MALVHSMAWHLWHPLHAWPPQRDCLSGRNASVFNGQRHLTARQPACWAGLGPWPLAEKPGQHHASHVPRYLANLQARRPSSLIDLAAQNQRHQSNVGDRKPTGRLSTENSSKSAIESPASPRTRLCTTPRQGWGTLSIRGHHARSSSPLPVVGRRAAVANQDSRTLGQRHPGRGSGQPGVLR